MITPIQRDVHHTTLTIANGANLSDALDFRLFSMLTVLMPAAWTAASIAFKVCSTNGGTYLPLYDDNGNLVQIDSPAVDKAYAAPPAVAGAIWVKLWSQNGSGTNTNQGAARSLIVDVKS